MIAPPVTHIITRSPEETIRAGEEFGRTRIQSGTVVTLQGELGAGKTHFVKGIAGALGIDERELTSPTFSLANEFECSLNGEPFTLFHLDCYRFSKPEELLELGVEDYLYPANAATIVEWPERIVGFIPPNAIQVSVASRSETERDIAISNAA
jgi:tRNA threonylcarbamoyladenosine biosynthesis protein TsaE